MTTDKSFAGAVRLHQAGKLAEAEAAYRHILAKTPNHSDALHLLGVLAGQNEQLDQAIDLISRAIAGNPKAASYHCNLGEMYRRRGTLDQAVRHARRSVELNPRLIEGQIILGVILSDSGRIDEAIEVFGRAIVIDPRSFAAQLNLGNALTKKKEFEAGIAAMGRAIELAPDSATAHFNLGNTLREARQIDAAILAFRVAIKIDANFAEAHCNLGDVLREQGQLEEAIFECRRAIELKPAYAEAYCNLGAALAAGGKIDDALAAYHRAIEINPSQSESHNNLGNTMVKKKRFAEGIAAIRRAIEMKPDFSTAYYNLGNALQENGQVDEAIAAHDAAIKLRPDYAHAHFNRSLIFLLRGDYARGWPGYEWRRWAEPMFLFSPGRLTQPQWDGSELNGRIILLHAEQGFGDTLQAARYFPLVIKKGGRVILYCQPELARILHDFPEVEQIVTPAEPLPQFDLHCPMMSLPAVFSTELNSIPSHVPYVAAHPGLAAQWKSRIGRLPAGLNVGIAWAGSRTHKLDKMRSIAVEHLSALGNIPFVNLISLQKGEAAAAQSSEIHWTDWTDDLHDFADTAALICGLDLVITVDTAVAHLAGAMGKKVWILLATPPDWRWLLDRDDSPWYPTARLFRQKIAGDWGRVIHDVDDALQIEARLRRS